MMTQMSKSPSYTSSASNRVADALTPALFKALGDSTRVALIAWLGSQSKPRTVTEIASSGCCTVDLSVVSRHLRLLRAAGVVEAHRRGREVLYGLRVRSIAGSLRRIADLLESCCAPQTRSNGRSGKG